MGTTGQFGYDSAKGPVLVNRRLDDRRMHAKLVVHDGGGRLVTTRLNTQD
jgi:hypothetical protein